MRIKLSLTEQELDLLIRLLDEEIDDMVYFNYSTAGTKNDISEIKAKLQIYRKCGEVFINENRHVED